MQLSPSSYRSREYVAENNILSVGAGLTVAPFLFFFITYVLLLSQNLSITHDSIEYLLEVAHAQLTFHANHLLYQPSLHLIAYIFSLLGIDINIQIAIEIVSALAGALALQAAYLIMLNRLHLNPLTAWAGLFACGFSFGIWYYSVAIEIYTIPLCFLAWSFYFLLNENLSNKIVFIAAVLHSLAILFHQTAILFAFVPVFAILTISNKTFFQRIALLAVYVLTGTVLVSSTYIGIAFFIGATESLQEFLIWFLGYGSSSKYWSPMSPIALVLAAVGFGRALIGAHFMFGIPEFRELFETVFAGNSLQDEIFFTQNLSPLAVYILCGLTIVTLGIVLFMFIMAIKNFLQGNFASPRRPVLLLLAWLLPYTLFFIAWDASNVDLWVLQVFIFWILITTLIIRKTQDSEQRPVLLMICALGLFIVNGLGSILPAKEPTLDYYQMCVNQFKQHVKESDFLYIGDAWPLATHLEYHSDIKFSAISLMFEEVTVANLAQEIQNRLQGGQKVYLSPDVFSISSSSENYYGEEYVKYATQIQSRVCGSQAINLEMGMKLVELTCIR